MVHPSFAVFIAAVATLQGSHAVLYALGTIHWHELGIGAGEIGGLWALSVAVEVVFLLAVGGATIALPRARRRPRGRRGRRHRPLGRHDARSDRPLALAGSRRCTR